MKKIFRKISAIAATALMIGTTMGVAAAASYPAPFVSGGSANVAIVYGTGEGVSSLDLVQAGNLQSNLQSYLSGGTGTSTSISGEAAELYTGGTKIYISDAINKVKSTLTKSDLPNVLADGSFSGNVDATYTQTIQVGAPSGNANNITFAKQPTTDDDPNLAISMGTSTSTPAFNLSVTFSKAVGFSWADSEGEEITLFGQKFTIAAATDNTSLVLLKSAEKVGLSSDAPTADVTVGGKTYTVELVSASDTSATIKVTDETGASEQKEVNEAASKKINGVTIAVQTADETNLKLSASIVAGSEKVTLASNANVKVGESDTSISGTSVDFAGGNPGALSKMTISVAPDDSDKDAVKVGQAFLDPAFGSSQLALNGFNIADDSASRETIKVTPSGDNRMEITFTDARGNEKNVRYQNYLVTGAGTNASLYYDDSHHNISVTEWEKMHKSDYLVLGNEDEGRLVKVSTVSKVNSEGTTGSGDKLEFTDVFSGDTYTATLTANTTTIASGSVVIGGKSYNVYVEGAGDTITDSNVFNVSVDYPDSSGNNIILFPTIQTSKGAKVAFYEAVNLTYNLVKNTSGFGSNLTGVMFPNGNARGYLTLTLTTGGNANQSNGSCSGATAVAMNGTTSGGGGLNCNITSTGFGYNITYVGAEAGPGVLSVRLYNANGQTPINDPAVYMFEEKDDNSVYEGLIVTSEFGSLTSTDPIGVNDVERTWMDDQLWDSITMASQNTIDKEVDLWGTMVSTDRGASSAKKVTISYPDEQVYALVSIGAPGSSVGVVGGSSGAQLGEVLAMDSEVSSVSSKNLIVVGGSCINSVAANLVGQAYCGSAWTTATGVGSGQFLIQSFADKYTAGKIALLVAGYEAADTINAATYLRTKAVDTAAGKKYVGTSATSATLVTETA